MNPRIPLWLVIGLTVAAALIFAPFAPWMALSLWLGLYARKFHRPLARKLGGRQGLAASLTVSLLLIFAIPLGIIITSLVVDAIALVQSILEADQTKQVLASLVSKKEPAPPGGDSLSETTSGAIDLLLSQGDRAWAIFQMIAGAAASAVIGLLIMITGMYGVLVSGQDWYHWLERHTPLDESHFRRFGSAFMETGRGLWFGIVGAGAIQSIIATGAYLIIGVPSALALGMLTLLFSVIPAIGTALVWGPVAAGLAITGRPVAAVGLALVGTFVIGTVDNVARPYLARRGELALPTWVVLVSMFGGIELVGGWGLLLGPLLVRMAKEALIIYREERIARQFDPTREGRPSEQPPSNDKPTLIERAP